MLSYFLMPHPPIIIPEVGNGREEEVRNTINASDISEIKADYQFKKPVDILEVI